MRDMKTGLDKEIEALACFGCENKGNCKKEFDDKKQLCKKSYSDAHEFWKKNFC